MKSSQLCGVALVLSVLVLCCSACTKFFTVSSGDYCYQIASTNGLSLNQLIALNNGVDCNNLQIGQILCLAASSTTSAPTVKATTTKTPTTTAPTVKTTTKAPTSAACTTYTVVSGDYCYAIADKYKISVATLQQFNPSMDCNNLSIGQKLCVTAGSSSTTKAPVSSPTTTAPSSALISKQQFITAVTSTGFGYPTPTDGQYNAFINNYASAGGITSKLELAMFLTNIMWESGGLQYKSELACQNNNCAGSYRTSGDDPNLFYFGRGYIQLSWSYNYRAASQALYGDTRLVTNPGQVASDENVAWQTAFWFWKVNVRSDPRVLQGQFGASINAINGGLECSPCQGNCNNRIQIYSVVLKAFGITSAPNTSGC